MVMKLAVISQKGGSGKTSLSLHVGVEATRAGLRVLLVDLDPQGNATKWAGRRGDLPPDVAAESPAALDSVLADAEREGVRPVIFDTAPNADRTALRAAKAADFVMIPCRPSQFDIEAIGATLDLCELAKRPAIIVLNAAPIPVPRGRGGPGCRAQPRGYCVRCDRTRAGGTAPLHARWPSCRRDGAGRPGRN